MTEFSHQIALDRVEEEPLEVALSPDEATRAGIASRLGLVSLDSLEAKVRVWFLKGRRTLALEGEIEADAVQSCIVTLEPVPEHVSDIFAEIQGAPLGEAEALALFPDHPDFDPDEAADPEPLDGDGIDVAEIITQYLSLSLDPYPKTPEAVLDEKVSGGASGVEINGPERDPETHPFAGLAALKSGPKKN